MRGRFARLVGIAAAIMPWGTIAMSMNGKVQLGTCTVVGGDNLPAGSGSAEALCAAIERAIAVRAPTARYKVEVKVISASRLSAGLTVNGRALPEQRFAVMDRGLNPGSIERFVESLTEVVVKAAKP